MPDPSGIDPDRNQPTEHINEEPNERDSAGVSRSLSDLAADQQPDPWETDLQTGDIPKQDAASKARPSQFRDLFRSVKNENGILRSLSLAEVHDFRRLLIHCRRAYRDGPGAMKTLQELAADLHARLKLPDNDTDTLNRMTLREIVEALQHPAKRKCLLARKLISVAELQRSCCSTGEKS